MANMYWRQIPPTAKIKLIGKPGAQSYVAYVGRKKFFIYWDGRESREAQTSLDRRAGKSASAKRRSRRKPTRNSRGRFTRAGR